MARHFLTLYVLIVLTLAVASWGQDRLWEAYAHRDAPAAADAQTGVLKVVAEQLRSVPVAERRRTLGQLSATAGVDMELFELQDIAGEDTLARLQEGGVASMSGADGRSWMLKRLSDETSVLAYRYAPPDTRRATFEVILSLLFYAAIALVIMLWLWPLTRDLRRLEQSTATFGNRNWTFSADIKPRSQIYPLAQAFQRMARRIDTLIGSHKDMSNAVAHEIKTPLARMRFELEMARGTTDSAGITRHLNSINSDIAELDGFLKAALDYAILERAEVALNLGMHDFTIILPAVTEAVKRSGAAPLDIRCEVDPTATRVQCDAHLIETVLRNLLYNAMRYARSQIRVGFSAASPGWYVLEVDDDGPGIPQGDRERVFGTFVKLGGAGANPSGHGLGLAIVRRAIEWHRGEVSVSQSPLGGARFTMRWPKAQ